MSTRKIIDAKQNGEKVWLKGHAQATFMSNGSTVEDAINNIEIPSLDDYVTETELNDKGFLTEHQDISHLASKEWVNNNNYATKEDLSSIEFNSLQNNPLVENSDGEFNLVDDLGNVRFKVNEEGLFVKDVIAGNHVLSNKQDRLVSGTNIKTINGESILGEGDLTIESGAKIYEWFYDGEFESVTLSQEEYDNIVEADLVIVKLGMLSFIVSKTGKEFAEATGECVLVGQFDFQGSKMYIQIVISIATKLATITIEEQAIPTKTSELENDSNFVTSDGLKTINGQSLIGSGDIVISGGGSSSGSGAYAEVNHGTSDTTFTLTPNTFHVWDEIASLTLDFGSETTGVANEYLFQFTSGATATSLTLPDDIKWTEELVIEPNMIYQVSILKGLASVLSWSNSTEIKNNFIDIQGNELVFQYPTTSELSINVYGRTTQMPSHHEIVVPSGSSSYVASNLSVILYINSVSPSSDSTYNYTFQMT